MYRRFSVNFALLSIALDALMVCAMLAAATNLRPALQFLPFAAHYPHVIPLPWVLYPIFAFEWVLVLSLFSIYDGRRSFSWSAEIGNLTLGTILAAMSLAGTLYISFREVSRLLFVSFAIMTYFATIAWRATARLIMSIGENKVKLQRKVLILGAGEIGQELYQRILSNPSSRLVVIGFLDDHIDESRTKALSLGPMVNILNVIKDYEPDDVVIALHQQDERIKQIIIDLHRQPVKVWLIPDYFRLALHKAAVEEFAGIPMLDLRAPALSDEQRLVKRAFDLLITILSMPFTIILMGFVSLLILIDDHGPVIFGQQRMGENGRLFTMYKFRTMVPGSEEMLPDVEKLDEKGQPVHKRFDDPRITRIGKILRRTSLDELPQVFNVIKGEMSLVGPRPELPFLVDRYETWQRQRFAVPQGITGWWQINGRSDRPMHQHTEDDLYYIQHYSLLFDLVILLRTITAVIQGKGAF